MKVRHPQRVTQRKKIRVIRKDNPDDAELRPQALPGVQCFKLDRAEFALEGRFLYQMSDDTTNNDGQDIQWLDVIDLKYRRITYSYSIPESDWDVELYVPATRHSGYAIVEKKSRAAMDDEPDELRVAIIELDEDTRAASLNPVLLLPQPIYSFGVQTLSDGRAFVWYQREEALNTNILLYSSDLTHCFQETNAPFEPVDMTAHLHGRSLFFFVHLYTDRTSAVYEWLLETNILTEHTGSVVNFLKKPCGGGNWWTKDAVWSGPNLYWLSSMPRKRFQLVKYNAVDHIIQRRVIHKDVEIRKSHSGIIVDCMGKTKYPLILFQQQPSNGTVEWTLPTTFYRIQLEPLSLCDLAHFAALKYDLLQHHERVLEEENLLYEKQLEIEEACKRVKELKEAYEQQVESYEGKLETRRRLVEMSRGGGRGNYDGGSGRDEFTGGRGGRGNFDGGSSGRGSFGGSPGGRGNYDGGSSGRGAFTGSSGGRGNYDGGSGGRGGGFTGSRGGRSDSDTDRSHRSDFGSGRGRSDDAGGRGGYSGGRDGPTSGRGGFESQRGGREEYESYPGRRGGYDGGSGGRGRDDYASDRPSRGGYDGGNSGGRGRAEYGGGRGGGYEGGSGGRDSYGGDRGGRNNYEPDRNSRDGNSSGRGGYDGGNGGRGRDEYTGGRGRDEYSSGRGGYDGGNGGRGRDEYSSARGGYSEGRGRDRDDYGSHRGGRNEYDSDRRDGYSSRGRGGYEGRNESREQEYGGGRGGRNDYDRDRRDDYGSGRGGRGGYDGGSSNRSHDYSDRSSRGGRDDFGGGRGGNRDGCDFARGGRGGEYESRDRDSYGGGRGRDHDSYGGGRGRDRDSYDGGHGSRGGGYGGRGGGSGGGYDNFGDSMEPPRPSFIPTYRTAEDILREDEERAEIAASANLYEHDGEVTVENGGEYNVVIEKWDDVDLVPKLRENILKAKYLYPRKIQKVVIPLALEGLDLKIQSATGSGKSAAFLVPIINSLAKQFNGESHTQRQAKVSALIISPTRELAKQLYEQAVRLTDGTGVTANVTYGQYRIRDNMNSIFTQGCDILVGCPGRLKDFFCERKYLYGDILKFLVLDEADELLQFNFMTDVETILNSKGFPGVEDRQTMFCSATFNSLVCDTANRICKKNSAFVKNTTYGNSFIRQEFIEVPQTERKDYLLNYLKRITAENDGKTPKHLVFVETKREADVVAAIVADSGMSAMTVNGDRTQEQREDAVRKFRSGHFSVLVATNVMSRGIDFHDLNWVVNMYLPKTPDEYVHRIGRTGRVHEGKAISFFDPNSFDDRKIADELMEALRITNTPIPDFMKADRDNGTYVPPSESEGRHFNETTAADLDEPDFD